MQGADNMPLLMLSREGKGRVALLTSDQIWLWARGFQGGGPHIDLLRKLAHWLMKEPELEEEALRATAKGREMTTARHGNRTPAAGHRGSNATNCATGAVVLRLESQRPCGLGWEQAR